MQKMNETAMRVADGGAHYYAWCSRCKKGPQWTNSKTKIEDFIVGHWSVCGKRKASVYNLHKGIVCSSSSQLCAKNCKG